ncbi:MAG: GHKL domain-containing protein [Acidobacteria bacterium]|nr:MAG: GHKL domain-containing protein [Acidobacteriota bacterium]
MTHVADRYDELLSLIHALASGDLAFRLRVPKAGEPGVHDDLEAVFLGLNMLAEELEATTVRRDAYQTALDELQRTQAQLVQSAKLAALGELAAGVGHEMNQPLQVICNHIEELPHLVEERDHEEILRSADEMQDAVGRASEVIRQLRTFARDAVRSEREHIDVGAMVHDSLVLFREDLRVRGIEVILDLADDLPPIHGNPIEVQQVITNLVLNARDAVTGRENATITLRTSVEPGAVLIDIQDTGPGVLPELRKQIFNPFFTSKSEENGTGLGLTISEQIMRRHGGTLTLRNNEPPGAHFTLRFPAEAP